ncbi:hypothetical protein PRZ48_008017 [Zasmidium cellare]|uniref:Uncharacterized protein n=1 Tax=Zasmidium cellare TaxID=395010 RepID=A0ABR0EEA6_ZASCE|nr:hypothetical protein PRZ48_008017 [Zasmidium cellare]
MAGVPWHLATFEDDVTGEFYHHFVPAADSPLRKRGTSLAERDDAQYDNEQWTDGGLLLHICPVNTGVSLTGISATASDNFDNFYQQLKCDLGDVSREAHEATIISVDIFNTDSTMVASAAIISYGAAGGPGGAAAANCPGSGIAASPGFWTS